MPVRPLYEATILLGGSRDNSVYLPAATAAELFVLRVIHSKNETGNDPITNVKATGKGVDRTDAQERARIGVRYNAAGPDGGIAILNALYGVGNPLPLEYTTPEPPAYDSDAPLPREQENVIDLEPEGPITSIASPKKTKASVLDDA